MGGGLHAVRGRAAGRPERRAARARTTSTPSSGSWNPQGAREENGKITYEGRYRVWKEIWMLNYLGRSARYD